MGRGCEAVVPSQWCRCVGAIHGGLIAAPDDHWDFRVDSGLQDIQARKTCQPVQIAWAFLMARKTSWSGVFPAITTQMRRDGSMDVEATASHAEVLIASGISGLIFLGSLGENQSLAGDEKRTLLSSMVGAVNGRVPVLSGVAENSVSEAVRFVRDAERIGVDGFMLMPPMVYRSPDPRETLHHFTSVARATGCPIMIYNNPISYGHDLTPELMARLGAQPNFVAIKESSGNTRRLTDLRRVCGDRFALFTGVDDLVLESAVLGIDGWVAGSGIAFPLENQHFWELTRSGRWEEARELYQWFTPLLHLDVHPKFVQYIKLAVQEAGLGVEWVRAPRLSLTGPERRSVLKIIQEGIRNRPKIQKSSTGGQRTRRDSGSSRSARG